MTMSASRKFINYTFQKIVDAATYTAAGFVKYCPKIAKDTTARPQDTRLLAVRF